MARNRYRVHDPDRLAVRVHSLVEALEVVEIGRVHPLDLVLEEVVRHDLHLVDAALAHGVVVDPIA